MRKAGYSALVSLNGARPAARRAMPCSSLMMQRRSWASPHSLRVCQMIPSRRLPPRGSERNRARSSALALDQLFIEDFVDAFGRDLSGQSRIDAGTQQGVQLLSRSAAVCIARKQAFECVSPDGFALQGSQRLQALVLPGGDANSQAAHEKLRDCHKPTLPHMWRPYDCIFEESVKTPRDWCSPRS